GVHEISQSELPHVAHALEGARVYEPHRERIDADVVPERVTNDLERHRPCAPATPSFSSPSRPRRTNGLRHAAEPLEVLAEHAGELLRLGVVRRAIAPSAA